MNYFKKFAAIILVIVLSFFAVKPLFSAAFFRVHDDTQVARVYEMKTALADGMFPVRWVPDLGYNYGYPIFNFYGPLAYYVGGIFNLFGFDSLIATKIMIGLGTLLAGICMYLLAKEFWGKVGGIVAAMLYMYAPYHALNIYVRGAIGELWAYGFLPLAFLALYKIFENVTKKSDAKSKISNRTNVWYWIAASALGYSAIVVSHNLTAMMVTPFLFGFAALLYCIARFKFQTNKSFFILLSFLLGILLASFYWLPVLFEMQYTNVLSVVGGGSDYKDHFLCLSQLWESQWGFAGSAPGCVDGMSFKIGKLHILLAVLALIPMYIYRSRKPVSFAILLSLLTAFFSIFLTSQFSKFIWDSIPHMAFFQFPWRFLLLITFCLSFVGGAIFILLQKKATVQIAAGIVVIAAIIVFNGKLFAPDKMYEKSAKDFTTHEELSWNISLISDEYMPKGFQKPRSVNDVPKQKLTENKDIKIISYSEKTTLIKAEIEAAKQTEVLLAIAYFPGWHVYLDHKQQEFKYFKKGLLVNVPQGKHTLEVVFTQTPIEILGNALSLTGVIVLLAGIILSRKANKRG